MNKHTNNKNYIIYIAIIFIILIIPFAFMAVTNTATGTDRQNLKSLPKLVSKEGKVNIKYLSQLGDYFADHFAFRSDIILANTKLKRATVKSNPKDEVIMGKNGWLFYNGSMDEYLGKNLLSEREIFDIAHNLNLIKEYADERGAKFLFTIVPNKNTIFSEYMPFNYIKSDTNNEKNLSKALSKTNINYLDLYDTLKTKKKTINLSDKDNNITKKNIDLYFKRDSHFNNLGASMAYDAMLTKLAIKHKKYDDTIWSEKKDHIGDLDDMLFMSKAQKEEDYYPVTPFTYGNINKIKDNMDPFIETTNPAGSGSLLMYRDSFGESLLPFFAENFKFGYFTRYEPYDLSNIDTYKTDTVILEKVDRKLLELCARVPIMMAPEVSQYKVVRDNSKSSYCGTGSNRLGQKAIFKAKKDGDYNVISGEIDTALLGDKDNIYISIKEENGKEKIFKPFYLSNKERLGNEFAMYLTKDQWNGEKIKVTLFIGEDEKHLAKEYEYTLNI